MTDPIELEFLQKIILHQIGPKMPGMRAVDGDLVKQSNVAFFAILCLTSQKLKKFCCTGHTSSFLSAANVFAGFVGLMFQL